MTFCKKTDTCLFAEIKKKLTTLFLNIFELLQSAARSTIQVEPQILGDEAMRGRYNETRIKT